MNKNIKPLANTTVIKNKNPFKNEPILNAAIIAPIYNGSVTIIINISQIETSRLILR